MNDELLIELGYNGIEHLVAQLQTLDQYEFPTEPFRPTPTPSGKGAVWGKITGNLDDQADLIARLGSLQTTIEEAIIAEIGHVFTYKGTVATFNDLPTEENRVGDIWNVADTGANYCWDGSKWDKLSETLDLSNYVDKDLFEDTLKLYYIKDEVDTLINALNLNLENKISNEEAARMMDISEVKGLISDETSARETAINGLNALIQQEVSDRQAAISTLDNKIDSVKDDLETADAELQTAIDKVADDLAEHIADADHNAATKAELAQAVSDLESADTTLQANIDKVASDLQKHIDDAETGFVTNAEFNQEKETRLNAETALQNTIEQTAQDLTNEIDKKVNKTDVFKNGVFQVENTKPNGTYTKIWNESDGGGTQIIDGTTNVKAYTGVHEGGDGTDIYVQTYAVDKDDNTGTRINVNKDGAYYTTGKNTYKFTAEDEISTKKDFNNYYNKSEVDDLIQDIDAGQIRTDLDNEIHDRLQADTDLQVNIDKVAEDLQKHIDEAETGYVTNAQLDEEIANRTDADTALSDRLDIIEGKDFVEYVDISTEETPNRKAILLDNHNGIFGKDLNGAARLISMVSKYDVVDFGAKSLHTNLNTKQIVTINDEQAVVTDKNLQQMLLSGDNITINKEVIVDPETQFAYNTFTVNADLSGLNTKIAKEEQVRAEADAELQDNINTVAGSLADLDVKLENHITDAEETFATKIALSGEETARTNADTALQANIDLKADSADVYTKTETDTLLSKKTDKEISSANGKALIFNEIDGGGAKFEGATRNSFAGVNDMTDANHIGVQLYNIDKETKIGPRINLTADRATYSINKTEVGEEYEIAIKQNLTDLKKAVDDKIDEINLNLASVFHYKGSVATYDDLPKTDLKTGDVYNIEDKGYNVAWSGTEWDKLSETIDLEPYDLTADRQAADAKIVSKIWNQADLDKGYFQTKATTEKGTAMIWNEQDGGGSKYEGKDGLWSYTGVNEGTPNKVSDLEGNVLDGRANEVMGQIYVYDSTNSISEKGNKGSWIDMTLDGFYYKKGTNSNVTVDDEIATVGKVKTVEEGLTTLQETVDTSLAHQDGNIQALLLQMAELQSKIEDLKSLDYEVVTLYDGSDTDFENLEKSFQLSGEVTANTLVDGKSVTLDDATVYSAFMELKATEDITLKNVTTSGLIYKTNTNAIYKLHADGYVSIRDCTFTPEVAYNGIEIGLGTGLAKSVIIDNCEFDGAFSNNAINIFGMDNGGVVTISNCHFHKLSNILRISNRTNTAWTINLINCTCDEWDTSEYAGMVLFQDYTSGSKEAADTNNQFAKITLNIQNCYKPDGTKIVMPDDLSTICSSKDENQIIYMWDAWRNFTEYGDKFPTINII